MPNKTNTAARLASVAILNAKGRAGTGWDLLGPDLQEALTYRETARLIQGQDLAKYEPAQALFDGLAAALADRARR